MLNHLSNIAQLVSGEPGNSGLCDMKAHDKLFLIPAIHEFLHKLFWDNLPTHLPITQSCYLLHLLFIGRNPSASTTVNTLFPGATVYSMTE